MSDSVYQTEEMKARYDHLREHGPCMPMYIDTDRMRLLAKGLRYLMRFDPMMNQDEAQAVAGLATGLEQNASNIDDSAYQFMAEYERANGLSDPDEVGPGDFDFDLDPDNLPENVILFERAYADRYGDADNDNEIFE